MKLTINLETEDVLTLKHVKCLIENQLLKLGSEYETISTDLVKPLDILETLEDQLGTTIPLTDFQDELEKQGFTKKESIKTIDELKKQGIIFEVRRGFVKKI